MGAFVRSVVPIPVWKGNKLPKLKLWVRAVFATYIILTIPMLALYFFFIIRIFPSIVLISWNSLLLLTTDFARAQEHNDVLGMMASVAQILILGLPVFGLSYLLASLSRKPITVLWRRSKPSTPRRVASTLTAVAALGLVAFLWAPQLPFSAKVVGPTGVPHLDVSGAPMWRYRLPTPKPRRSAGTMLRSARTA